MHLKSDLPVSKFAFRFNLYRYRSEMRAGDVMIREGDRVIQQRNDYTKEVFNGAGCTKVEKTVVA